MYTNVTTIIVTAISAEWMNVDLEIGKSCCTACVIWILLLLSPCSKFVAHRSIDLLYSVKILCVFSAMTKAFHGMRKCRTTVFDFINKHFRIVKYNKNYSSVCSSRLYCSLFQHGYILHLCALGTVTMLYSHNFSSSFSIKMLCGAARTHWLQNSTICLVGFKVQWKVVKPK